MQAQSDKILQVNNQDPLIPVSVRTTKQHICHFPSYKMGTFRKMLKEPGRNEPCYCKSGRKFKHCCLPKMDALMAKKVIEAHEKNEAGK